MDHKEIEFANHFASVNCGILHMHWAMDAFWGRICKDSIYPSALAIHDELIRRKQKKPHSFNDVDDSIYYVPCKDRKVFVHTTQSLDFLYVMSEDKFERSFHIRQLWRPYKTDRYEDAIDNIKTAIQNVEYLTAFSDDECQYGRRPSLNLYKKFDFEIPNHLATENKSPLDIKYLYGDFRDAGYILSYKEYLDPLPEQPPVVEGSRVSTSLLEAVATCYLPSIAHELEIKVPTPKGY